MNKELLQDIVASLKNFEDQAEKNKQIEIETFKQNYEGQACSTKNANHATIPKFFNPLPKSEDVLRQKLIADSRAALLRNITKELLDNEELGALWTCLDKNLGTSDKDKEEKFMDYQTFLKVKNVTSPKCKKFFTPTIFGRLQQKDPDGRISMKEFFNYVMRKTWHFQTRIGFSMYDNRGQGYLRESDLEAYISDLIPTLAKLEDLEESFYDFYICTAVRKFFFFLDPLRTQRVKIQDVLASGFLDDLLELRLDSLPVENLENNWFSATSALHVYGQYLHLDKDHNGVLSKEELAAYGKGTLTSVFIDRVFQECLTFEGLMDYKIYLDFVLSLKNKHEPQAIQYLFRCLDIDKKGYLDNFTLLYFFKAISKDLVNIGNDPISNFEDIIDEIYDMVKPKDPAIITLQDLIECGQGGKIVSLLIDMHEFWTYETREDDRRQIENS